VKDRAKKYATVLTFMVVVAIAAFALLQTFCHSDLTSLRFLTVCAFILTPVGVPFLTGVSFLLVNRPATRGVSVPFRMERPPCI